MKKQAEFKIVDAVPKIERKDERHSSKYDEAISAAMDEKVVLMGKLSRGEAVALYQLVRRRKLPLSVSVRQDGVFLHKKK